MSSFLINLTGGGLIGLLTCAMVGWTLLVYLLIAVLTARMSPWYHSSMPDVPWFDTQGYEKLSFLTVIPSSIIIFVLVFAWAAEDASRIGDEDNVGWVLAFVGPLVGWLLYKLAAVPAWVGLRFNKNNKIDRR